MNDLFDDAVAEIEAAYGRLGHQRGWRFLTTPRRTLTSDVKVAFLSQNPGGTEDTPSPHRTSCEDGSTYLCEAWDGYAPGKAPLQRQVQGMFAWLGRDPDATLSAYFIPFRSPSYDELVAREESRKFGVSLWRKIFRKVQPELIVCLGKVVEQEVRTMFEEAGDLPLTNRPYRVGWEPQRAWVTCYRERVLLRVPHLSHFKIFDRPASSEYLRVIRSEVEQRWAEVKQRRVSLAQPGSNP